MTSDDLERRLRLYFYEEWAVDWIAEQFPKMLEAFKEVGAI